MVKVAALWLFLIAGRLLACLAALLLSLAGISA
jgi:hypothetical protein